MATKEITLESIIRDRIYTYGFLARLYRVEVDDAYLDEMCKMKFPRNTGNADVDEGYKLIREYLSNRWERTITELRVDYCTTFLGTGPDCFSAAYPFESVHTSAFRLLMQGARDDVLKIYQAAGLGKNKSWREGEDHIALELEFMQILSIRSLDLLKKGNEEEAGDLLLQQYDFLQNHLLNWVPMLVGEINKLSSTDFYKGLGKLTIGFLKTDREFLEDILEEELAMRREREEEE